MRPCAAENAARVNMSPPTYEVASEISTLTHGRLAGRSCPRLQEGQSTSAFVEYFSKTWEPFMERWVKAVLEGIDNSGQWTNGAIEGYHAVLKDLHLKGRKRLIGRRLDWLIHMLLSQVDEHYWCGGGLKASVRTVG